MDTLRFNSIYKESGSFVDKFQTVIKLLPVTTNNSGCSFDVTCGFDGIVGRFFRNLQTTKVNPISDVEKEVLVHLNDYLINNRNMDEDSALSFLNVFRDILCQNGKIQAIDSSFLKYYPLAQDRGKSSKSSDKYVSGQKKIADMLSSMFGDFLSTDTIKGKKDLFTSTIKEALDNSLLVDKDGHYYGDEQYNILPFIQKQFKKDFLWLLSKEDYVLVKYIDIFLYFYACYSILQTLLHITPEVTKDQMSQPFLLYNILSQESTSIKGDAIIGGWESKLSTLEISKIFGRLQAVDILNTFIKKETCSYFEIVSELEKEPFEQNKVLCENFLSELQYAKIEHINKRETSRKITAQPIDTSVESYSEFARKVYAICVRFQETTYDRIKKRIYDLFSIRFLSWRRGKYLLNLDNEMLIFLIAMITHEEKTRIKDLYKKFGEYGIIFNRNTRSNIEQYLLRLNLLDRKSDSGEVQYVKVIL